MINLDVWSLNEEENFQRDSARRNRILQKREEALDAALCNMKFPIEYITLKQYLKDNASELRNALLPYSGISEHVASD